MRPSVRHAPRRRARVRRSGRRPRSARPLAFAFPRLVFTRRNNGFAPLRPRPSRSAAPLGAARAPIDFFPKLEDLAAPFVPAKRTLNEGIADFYDDSSELWERVWGEHMHHGYYPGGVPRPDHTRAQVDMIDEALRWAGVDDDHPVASLLDVGCGIGGSSRHIASFSRVRRRGRHPLPRPIRARQRHHRQRRRRVPRQLPRRRRVRLPSQTTPSTSCGPWNPPNTCRRNPD